MAILHENGGNVLKTFNYHKDTPKSTDYEVEINGHKVFVFKTSAGDFINVQFSNRLDVTVTCAKPFDDVVIRPLKHKISPTIEGNMFSFSINMYANLIVDIEGGPSLMLFLSPLVEDNIPSGALIFKEGEIYNAGEIILKSGQCMHIEGGAVVRATVRAADAKKVCIRGSGVLDGSLTAPNKFVVLEKCKQVSIQDIILIEPASWMLVLGNCNDVTISNIKELGSVVCSDGIDIVGSKNIHISGCFIKNNDDCIVLKALTKRPSYHNMAYNWDSDIDNILVRDCVLVNGPCGNALEIGYETECDNISGVTFRDCDIITVHGYGAAFSIHNGDRAKISNVTYEDIRVEHYYDKLIDFRILHSKYNTDTDRGHIENIKFKNIYAMTSIHNAGHTISLIGGYDKGHLISGVEFDGFFIDDKKITNCDELDLYVKNGENIVFK